MNGVETGYEREYLKVINSIKVREPFYNKSLKYVHKSIRIEFDSIIDANHWSAL